MKKYLPIILILLIAIFFRFYKLGLTPKGFYLDESSLGYSAYSIMKTGKDEFGKALPVFFRSFTTFQSPIYIYLLIPIYKFFGMNVWSTRLLSALAGVICVLFTYLIINRFDKKLSIICALLLAISPWHIIFSRSAYETNLALTFLIISLWCFYKSEKSLLYFLSSGFFAGLSFLTYQSERIIVPLVFLILAIKYRKKLSWLFITGLLVLVLIGPTMMLMTTPGFLARINSLSIESKHWLSLYSAYFSPRYLFSLGDSAPRSSYPDLATFYVWQFPLLMIGIWQLFKNKINKNLKFLIIILLFISPLPASLTKEPYSTIRALPMVIPLLLIISIGIRYSPKWIKYLSCLFIVLSFGRLYLSAFKFNDHFRFQYWDYGTKELTQELAKYKNTPIVVDNARGINYSQIIFFNKYDPHTYQINNFEVSDKEYYTNMNRNNTKIIDNITLRPINWEKDIFIEQILVGNKDFMNDNTIKEHCLQKLFEIKGADNQTVMFVGVKTNPDAKRKYNLLLK